MASVDVDVKGILPLILGQLTVCFFYIVNVLPVPITQLRVSPVFKLLNVLPRDVVVLLEESPCIFTISTCEGYISECLLVFLMELDVLVVYMN